MLVCLLVGMVYGAYCNEGFYATKWDNNNPEVVATMPSVQSCVGKKDITLKELPDMDGFKEVFLDHLWGDLEKYITGAAYSNGSVKKAGQFVYYNPESKLLCVMFLDKGKVTGWYVGVVND